MSDEQFYLEAAEEVSRGVRDKALAAKAFAKAGGDERKMHAVYIELRVEQLKAAAAKAAALKTKEAVKRGGTVILDRLKLVGVAVFVLFGIGFFIFLSTEQQPYRPASGETFIPLPPYMVQAEKAQLRETEYQLSQDKPAALEKWYKQLEEVRTNARSPKEIQTYEDEYQTFRRYRTEYEFPTSGGFRLSANPLLKRVEQREKEYMAAADKLTALNGWREKLETDRVNGKTAEESEAYNAEYLRYTKCLQAFERDAAVK